MRLFLWGMLTMAAAVAALFFMRYWRRTHDRLFCFFGLAFALMSANWASLILTAPQREPYEFHVYVVRLVAFGLIVAGIVDKNRRGAPR